MKFIIFLTCFIACATFAMEQRKKIDLVTQMVVTDGSPDEGKQLRLLYDEETRTLHFAFCNGIKITKSIDHRVDGPIKLWDQVRIQGFALLKKHIFAVILAKATLAEDSGSDFAHFYLVERDGIKQPRKVLRSTGIFAHFEFYNDENRETIDIETTCFNNIQTRVGKVKSSFYYGNDIKKMIACDNQDIVATDYEVVPVELP